MTKHIEPAVVVAHIPRDFNEPVWHEVTGRVLFLEQDYQTNGLYLDIRARYSYEPEIQERGPSYGCAGQPGEDASVDFYEVSVRAYAEDQNGGLVFVGTLAGSVFLMNAGLVEEFSRCVLEYEGSRKR